MMRIAIAVVLGMAVVAGPARAATYHGTCTNAYTSVHRPVFFRGRVRAGTLVGRLRSRPPCPRGAVNAPCVPHTNFVHCTGTVGTQGCTLEGDLYGHYFQGDYTCPGGNLAGALGFH